MAVERRTSTNRAAKKRAPAKRSAPARKVAKKRAPAKRSAPARKVAKKRAPAKRSAPARKVAKKRAPAKRSAPARKVAKKRAPAKRSAPARKVAKKRAPAKRSAPARKVAKKRAPAKRSAPARKVAKKRAPGNVFVASSLPVAMDRRHQTALRHLGTIEAILYFPHRLKGPVRKLLKRDDLLLHARFVFVQGEYLEETGWFFVSYKIQEPEPHVVVHYASEPKTTTAQDRARMNMEKAHAKAVHDEWVRTGGTNPRRANWVVVGSEIEHSAQVVEEMIRDGKSIASINEFLASPAVGGFERASDWRLSDKLSVRDTNIGLPIANARGVSNRIEPRYARDAEKLASVMRTLMSLEGLPHRPPPRSVFAPDLKWNSSTGSYNRPVP